MRKPLFYVFFLTLITGTFFLAGCLISSTGEDHTIRRLDCTWTTPSDSIACGEFARDRDCFNNARTFEACLGYHCTTCE